jgi:hypothetical protein
MNQDGLACTYRMFRADAVPLHDKCRQLVVRPLQTTPNTAFPRLRPLDLRDYRRLRRCEFVARHCEIDDGGDGDCGGMAARRQRRRSSDASIEAGEKMAATRRWRR